MIVCLCRAVPDRAVRQAAAAGARTVEEIGAATGAGTECGCCRGAIAALLAAPCGPAPCPACPRRAPAPDGIPARVAAEGLKAP